MDANKMAIMVLAKRRGAEKPDESEDDDSDVRMPSMEDIAADLLSAIARKDKAAVAKALRASQVCESEDDEDAE